MCAFPIKLGLLFEFYTNTCFIGDMAQVLNDSKGFHSVCINPYFGDLMGYILVIDDDENICYLLHSFLTEMGYDVKIAHDGEEGIKHFDKSCDFDLVITDIRMPRMDGCDVARHIRSSDRSYTPIVGITGFSENAIREEFFNSLLVKPFNLEALKDVVTSLTKNC
jgi:CheY-like chemotaxis protein